MSREDPRADLVWGRHPVLEALRAGERLDEVLLLEGQEGGPLGEIAGRAAAAGVPVRRAPRWALDRAVRGANHQGVVARVADFVYSDLDLILARAIRADEPPFLLALDRLQDVHNVGSLLRTAEAAGMHGVLLADREAAGVTGAVRKASAGAVAHLPVARGNLARMLDALRARGVWVVGLDAEGETGWGQAELTGPLCLVVGGEGGGMRRGVAQRCDLRLRLPMRGQVASLNAAVAGSIAIFEALRQRLSDGAPVGGPGEGEEGDHAGHDSGGA